MPRSPNAAPAGSPGRELSSSSRTGQSLHTGLCPKALSRPYTWRSPLGATSTSGATGSRIRPWKTLGCMRCFDDCQRRGFRRPLPADGIAGYHMHMPAPGQESRDPRSAGEACGVLAGGLLRLPLPKTAVGRREGSRDLRRSHPRRDPRSRVLASHAGLSRAHPPSRLLKGRSLLRPLSCCSPGAALLPRRSERPGSSLASRGRVEVLWDAETSRETHLSVGLQVLRDGIRPHASTR